MRAQEVEDEAREMDGERGLSVLHVDLDSLLHEYNTPRFRIVHMKGQQYTAQNRLGRFSILPSCRPLTSAQLMFPFLTCAGNLTNCIPLCVLSTDRAGRDGRGRERLRDDCVEERECEPVVSDPFSAASNSLSISSDAQPVHTTHPHSQIAKSEERRRPNDAVIFPAAAALNVVGSHLRVSPKRNR
ncbi:hypothetical protein BLNAU_13329 [Blattamonas nauphoetae]|uniref:Uncharacterized protein n=1 Tax=Blattamonas nauphoetae TaxID=2049346 RepID=A0ABQ9XM71_9EUKA|nr:hypothetical protein BLNAU_13329 [Blattamonas nauphoetae]